MNVRQSFLARFSGVRSLIVSSVFVVGAALAPVAASAHFEGGSWPHQQGNALIVTYDNQCLPVSDWDSIVDLAAENWTWTPTVLWFSKASNSSCSTFAQQLDVLTGWDNDSSKLAYTTNWELDCFFFCWWDGSFEDSYAHSVIRINANNANSFGFASLDGFGQLEAVTHEMGHTLGLAHSGYYNGEHPAGPFASYPVGSYGVMDYCCDQSLDHPLQHDINDLNQLYPF